MTEKNKKRLALALDNAAEMIRSHIETGIKPIEVGETDLEGLREYGSSTKRAYKLISTLAKQYKQ